jgi:hypothetical protein
MPARTARVDRVSLEEMREMSSMTARTDPGLISRSAFPPKMGRTEFRMEEMYRERVWTAKRWASNREMYTSAREPTVVSLVMTPPAASAA